MAIQIFPVAGGTASFNGIFIPVGDLLNGGIEGATEFADAEPAALKRDKALFAICETTTSYIANLAAGLALGVTVTRPNVTTTSYTYGVTVQLHEILDSATPLAPLPVPSAGANAGVGDFAFTDIFPNAVKLAAAADPAGSGVLIETASMEFHGAPDHATLNLANDSRGLLGAMFRYFATGSDLPLRSATEASAITGKSAPAYSTTTLPAAATATTDPTTDIVAADLSRLIVVTQSGAVTFNLVASAPTPTLELELNSVTA
jgi:hypothetical protein